MLQGILTVKEALAYKQILKDFVMAASTEVSLSISKIFFFNTNIAIQRNISRILGFQREMLPSKYLGVPLIDKPLSKTIWEPVINKLEDKTRKWTSRSLNLVGRLVLTKAILQTVPIFMFSALPAPKGVLQLCRNIQRDFLLGKGEEKKKWALVAWEKICKPKTHGGLGLDDPKANSEGKWRKWKKLFYRDTSPLKAQTEALKNILEQRKILVSVDSDQLRRGHNNKGTFNLKEAKCITFGLDFTIPDRVWKDLWQNQGWMKIKLFMWLVQHKKILTWDNLQKRGVSGPSKCQLCESQEETIEHLLNLCPITSTLWNGIASILRQTDRDMRSITNTLKEWRKIFSDYDTVNKSWALASGFLIWDVWKEHNNRIFNNKKGSS
eukprot:PITA_31614